MDRRLVQFFVVALAVMALAIPQSPAQTINPLDALQFFREAEREIDGRLKDAEEQRVFGECGAAGRLLERAANVLLNYTPDWIGASGHARLSARVAAARSAPCPPPGGTKKGQSEASASDALGPRSRASEREDARELIEGAFAAAEAARLKGDCVRWNKQMWYLARVVSPGGRYTRADAKLFPEPVKREWEQRFLEFRSRPCPPPTEPGRTTAPAEYPAPAERVDDFALAKAIDAQLAALLERAETDRRAGECDRFRASIREADDVVRSGNALRFPPSVRDRWRKRIAEVGDRPCALPKPAPAPTGTLGDLRVALAKSCGPQFEPARAALLAGIDRAIASASDPQRLAVLRTDRAYIAGLPVTPCPPAPPPLMTGTFITNFGTMVLVDGRGTYTEKNGRVTPTRTDGNRLEADWQQSESARRCADGRFRGRLIFNFSASGFAGSWGYCDEEPRNAWSGQRR